MISKIKDQGLYKPRLGLQISDSNISDEFNYFDLSETPTVNGSIDQCQTNIETSEYFMNRKYSD